MNYENTDKYDNDNGAALDQGNEVAAGVAWVRVEILKITQNSFPVQPDCRQPPHWRWEYDDLLRLRWIWSSWQSWRWEPVDLDADDDDDDYIHDETYFSMRLRWNIENHSKFLPSSTKLQATTALHRTTIRKLPQDCSSWKVRVNKWNLKSKHWKVKVLSEGWQLKFERWELTNTKLKNKSWPKESW